MLIHQPIQIQELLTLPFKKRTEKQKRTCLKKESQKFIIIIPKLASSKNLKLQLTQSENASSFKMPGTLKIPSSPVPMESYEDPECKNSSSSAPPRELSLFRLCRIDYKFTVTAFLLCISLFFYYIIDQETIYRYFPLTNREIDKERIVYNNTLPHDLFGAGGVYGRNDFENNGNIVPYWRDVIQQLDGNHTTHENDEEVPLKSIHWGPCYPPNQSIQRPINWDKLIQENANETLEEQMSAISDITLWKRNNSPENDKDLSNLCRPGFIIIGAGKCGTSSLYHYLIGHPRIYPAIKKQIHYFKYYPNYPMKWYLSHFPTAKTFLASGSLMTGEASPGYMPYPDVAQLTHKRMVALSRKTGERNETPKIIAVVRNPLERAWSSYNYNYVQPALKKLRKKRKKLSDEYYRKNKLFSFEDLVKAELDLLKECLKPGGMAEVGARAKYGSQKWIRTEFEMRNQTGQHPLQDIEANCYGGRVSQKIPRKQWSNLVENYPNKFLNTPNLQLVESIVGRGLYTLPLEWWYAVFEKEDIFVLCSEDLRNEPSNSVSKITEFLGLPPFDFKDVVSEGMFNVGGHRGYDTPTEWRESNITLHQVRKDKIPISEELRTEFLEFVKPFNERLFQLIGNKCDW